jgi:GT2 family glycosyltransferase
MKHNIVVYTLTRDRLDYTKRSFASLAANAGMSYAHVVVDNGSTDGTQDWLTGEVTRGAIDRLVLLPANEGISRASNLALDTLFREFPRVQMIVKMDNDCLVTTPKLLKHMCECLTYAQKDPGEPTHILSPRVTGINRQPHRGRSGTLAGRPIGYTAIIGGLFHCVPAEVYHAYRYPEGLPLARGQDDDFCHWAKEHSFEVGYVEDLTVEHMDGTDAQAARYPDYFQRKFREEHQFFAAADTGA